MRRSPARRLGSTKAALDLTRLSFPKYLHPIPLHNFDTLIQP